MFWFWPARALFLTLSQLRHDADLSVVSLFPEPGLVGGDPGVCGLTPLHTPPRSFSSKTLYLGLPG